MWINASMCSFDGINKKVPLLGVSLLRPSSGKQTNHHWGNVLLLTDFEGLENFESALLYRA
jgi:hypothetical protein